MSATSIRLPSDEELIAAAGPITAAFVACASCPPESAAPIFFEVIARLGTERHRHEAERARKAAR
jgi:hypothetical protein